MNFLDWCLVVLTLAYAVSGYWQGFIAGAFATAGLLLGGLLGIWLAPVLLGDAAPSLWVSLGALFVVLVCASLGQAILQFVGTRIRARLTWQPIRAVDAVGGAVLSMVAVLLVAWMLGVAISGSRIPGISPQVRQSKVLITVNRLMPVQAQQALRSFDQVVGSGFFPRYLEPFAPERIINVDPANPRIIRDPDIRKARESVFKIRSTNRCGSGVEGTGFLYAPHRLMTNAHVVAGVTEPVIKDGDESVDGTVVYYNPDVDIAVINVPDLDGPALKLDFNGKEKDQAAVLGYPQDGPYDAQPARIRGDQRLRSPDIYGNGTVTRHVFSLRGLIRPGNSGGPLVSSAGRVFGVVFAASVSDKDTGYALTADQVRRAAALGLQSDDRVSSGNCASKVGRRLPVRPARHGPTGSAVPVPVSCCAGRRRGSPWPARSHAPGAAPA